ncbi:DUF7266 family protein [Natronorubrum halophilum]|uniref:DUF7266 family protein n=1 Tax=Natronorubrum halophilum TaxID=1702106 RepID=UPI000EF6D4FA|nr:hypothetical protein [Natronorubrum halophilum]
MIGNRHETDRGVSIALTHVLTIGIATILIAMLLMSGSTLLESETDRSARTALETVGERLAGEIANVDQIGNESEDAMISAEHPRTIANSQYTVELLDRDDDACSEGSHLLADSETPCIRLTAQEIDVTVYVPVAIDGGVSGSGNSVAGGTIEIAYDSADDGNEIEITEADR